MTPDACRSWLAEWSTQWRDKKSAIADRTETVEEDIAHAGAEPLDGAIADLCDVYLGADADGRVCIRDFFRDQPSFRQNLLAHVVRTASALRRDPRVRWEMHREDTGWHRSNLD